MPPKKIPPKTTRPTAVKPAAKSVIPKTGAKKTSTGGPSKQGAPAVKKAGVQVTGKTKTQEVAKVKKKWTKEDEAAKKIQTEIRRFLAKKALDKKKKEKAKYEQLMEDLEKEAFAKLVKMEQEKFEKERQLEEEERRRLREAQKRKKRILEAAFEGDDDEILTILKEIRDLDDKNGIGHDVIGIAIRNKNLMNAVECEDANGNTPLSEAASGGSSDTVRLIIEQGGNPNSQGQFMRTPLYRAAFAGHLENCQVLLQNGADPRIYAEDGQTPEQIASLDNIKDLLAEWDIEQTEQLLKKLEADREKRRKEEAKKREAIIGKLEEKVEEAEKDYKATQKRFMKATEELNKRIEEHDTAVASGFDRPQLTIQAIQDAEGELEIAKLDLEKARDIMADRKLKYREQKKDNAKSSGEELPGLKITIRELDDVLLRDVGNRIKDSGKWPLLMDTTGQASTFLRYRDTNYVDALSPSNMEDEKLRMALLGALRYGKPLVLDMMDVDMFETCAVIMDRLQKGLMDAIMDKSIIQEEVYTKLLRPSDGPDYVKTNFNDLRLQNFMFVIITKNPFPDESLLNRTYPIRIHVPV